MVDKTINIRRLSETEMTLVEYVQSDLDKAIQITAPDSDKLDTSKLMGKSATIKELLNKLACMVGFPKTSNHTQLLVALKDEIRNVTDSKFRLEKELKTVTEQLEALNKLSETFQK